MAMNSAPVMALLSLAVAPVEAAQFQIAVSTAANPVRKVVTLLQAIQEKVQKEGEKETELHSKYMCYCGNGAGTLGKSMSDANAKIAEVTSSIAEAQQHQAQLQQELAEHRADRTAAKQNMADATAVRKTEAATFATYKAEAESNIGALGGAIAAVERGVAGAFLQTGAAEALRKLVQSKDNMIDADRQDVLAFLAAGQSDSSSYTPQSGEITGILKQLHDEFSQNLADATSAEQASIQSFDELIAAKSKESAAATAAIEDKEKRSGETAVSLAQMSNDLGDTKASLAADGNFLADLEKNCATKKAEWDVIVKTRNEELVALADTIRILQDDDALELFKKTIPSAAAASFVQVQAGVAATRARALAMIKAARVSKSPMNTQLDFISLALSGKKIGFGKVIGMIDNMVTALGQEQKDDDAKKLYCGKEFDASDDKKKGLERSVSDAEASIAAAEEALATLTSEIKTLNDTIKALDKSVTEATEQRQNENKDFAELMQQDTAAKELLGVAKNRLNQFYNPKMYAPPPKRQLSADDRIVVGMGGTLAPTPAPGGIAGTGIMALSQVKEAPGAAPEAVPAYSKKSGETQGVLQMIDLLIKELDKEMTVGQTEETDSQADYEQMMKDSAEQRASLVDALHNKEAAKADTEAALQSSQGDKKSASDELGATNAYISSLHAECDWLLQYFSMRQDARASEIDALGKAKAVLSGADFSSLLQTAAAQRSLRGR